METKDKSHIKWRSRKLGYIPTCEQAPQKEGGGYRDSYIVLGFQQDKIYEVIPKKLQKNCRAFLKGTQKQTGINGLSKIIFSK